MPDPAATTEPDSGGGSAVKAAGGETSWERRVSSTDGTTEKAEREANDDEKERGPQKSPGEEEKKRKEGEKDKRSRDDAIVDVKDNEKDEDNAENKDGEWEENSLYCVSPGRARNDDMDADIEEFSALPTTTPGEGVGETAIPLLATHETESNLPVDGLAAIDVSGHDSPLAVGIPPRGEGKQGMLPLSAQDGRLSTEYIGIAPAIGKTEETVVPLSFEQNHNATIPLEGLCSAFTEEKALPNDELKDVPLSAQEARVRRMRARFLHMKNLLVDDDETGDAFLSPPGLDSAYDDVQETEESGACVC